MSINTVLLQQATTNRRVKVNQISEYRNYNFTAMSVELEKHRNAHSRNRSLLSFPACQLSTFINILVHPGAEGVSFGVGLKCTNI